MYLLCYVCTSRRAWTRWLPAGRCGKSLHRSANSGFRVLVRHAIFACPKGLIRVGFCLPKAGVAAEAGKLIRYDIVEGYRGAGWEVPEKTESIFQMCYSSDEGYSWEGPEALVVQYPIQLLTGSES